MPSENTPPLLEILQRRGTAAIVWMACILLAFGLVAIKASYASMTHDESSTWLNLIDYRVVTLWKCFGDPACWSTANNHLLNTQLMRWTNALFGSSELSLRLPNLSFFLLSLVAVFSFLRKGKAGMLLGILTITLFSCNPYVSDFHALARGYGMGLSLMTISMWCIWEWLQTKRDRYCAFAVACACLAVAANLTYVAFLVALLPSVLMLMFLSHRERTKQSWIRVTMAVVLLAGITALYFAKPVSWLIAQGEFTYGASTLSEFWSGYVRDSLYGKQWFGEKTVAIISYGSVGIIAGGILGAWIKANRQQSGNLQLFARFLSILCLCLIGFFLANHFITGAHFPSGRKSIILHAPMVFLCIVVLQLHLTPRKTMRRVVFTGIILFALIHFVATYQTHTFREWWYDTSTKEMVLRIAGTGTQPEPARLATDWVFHPTTHFYIKTLDLPVFLAPYSRDVPVADTVTYYYVQAHHLPVLETDYEVLHRYSDRPLLRKKGTE